MSIQDILTDYILILISYQDSYDLIPDNFRFPK